MVGATGGPVDQAFVSALASPAKGHTPLLAVKDKVKIYENNYKATKFAIERAITGKPTVKEVLARKDSAKHPFA